MNIQSHLRHYLTFLGALGTIFLGWQILTPDQVDAANEAGAKLIEPLTILIGLVAVTVFRIAVSWLGKIFRVGSGEVGNGTNSGHGSGGGLPAILLVCGAAGFMGCSLPSCTPAQLSAARAFPLRIGIQGPDAALSYSSKHGIEVNAVIRGEK